MVEDLTHYLYTNNMLRYIEGYVQKVSPAKAPQVVGSLLDCEAPDEFITNLILSVRSLIPVEGLCAEVKPSITAPLPVMLLSRAPTLPAVLAIARYDSAHTPCMLADQSYWRRGCWYTRTSG